MTALRNLTKIVSYTLIFGLGAYIGDSYNVKNRFIDITHPNIPINVKTYPYIHDLSLDLRIVDKQKVLFLEDKKHDVTFRVNRDGSAGTPEEQIKKRIIKGFSRLKREFKHNIEDIIEEHTDLKDKANIVYMELKNNIQKEFNHILNRINHYFTKDDKD